MVQYFRHFLYGNSTRAYCRRINLYSVISVKMDSLPANTKNGSILENRHIRHINRFKIEWCHTFVCMALDSFIWDMTRSYGTWLVHMGHDSFIWDMTRSYGTWLVHMGHDSFIWDMTRSYETWLVHMGHDSFIWDMTRSYGTCLVHMGHDSFIWDMTRSHGTCLVHMGHNALITRDDVMRYDSFIMWCETWLVHMGHDSLMTRDGACDSTHLWCDVRHDSFTLGMTPDECHKLYLCVCVSLSLSLSLFLSLSLSLFLSLSHTLSLTWHDAWRMSHVCHVTLICLICIYIYTLWMSHVSRTNSSYSVT